MQYPFVPTMQLQGHWLVIIYTCIYIYIYISIDNNNYVIYKDCYTCTFTVMHSSVPYSTKLWWEKLWWIWWFTTNMQVIVILAIMLYKATNLLMFSSSKYFWAAIHQNFLSQKFCAI